MTIYVKFSGDGEELSAEENPLLIISGNGLTLQYNKELSIISDQEQVFFLKAQNIYPFFPALGVVHRLRLQVEVGG